MNVAIFTDNDFGKVNGVTTTLTAALDCAPAGMQLRVYTAAALPVETGDYLALKLLAVPIPFYGEMDMFVPRFSAYLNRAREDRIDLVHLTTPGPLGLAARHTACRLQLPMVGSFHIDPAAYTGLLSGSRRLGALMREYMAFRRVEPPLHGTVGVSPSCCRRAAVLEYANATNASLAPPSAPSFAQAIRAAVTGDERRLRAAAEAAHRFRWDAVTARYFAVYDQLALGRRLAAGRRTAVCAAAPSGRSAGWIPG